MIKRKDMLKLASKNDHEKLKEFYKKAYGKTHILNDSAHTEWQFQKNPFNTTDDFSLVIAENDNQIIAHLGFIPIQLKFLDSTKVALWHISFYTLENFQGKGLGTKMIKLSNCYGELSMVLNGSGGTKKIYENLDGKDLGNMNRYIAILNKKRISDFVTNNLEKNEIENFSIKKEQIRRIRTLDEDYDNFWNAVKERFPITVNRTKEYLEWRYLHHPLIDYHFLSLKDENKLKGFAVIRFEDNNNELKAARLVDLICYEDYDNIILKNVVNYCREKSDFLDFFCTGMFYKKALEEIGFFNNTEVKIKIPVVFNPIDFNRREDINFFYNYHKKNKQYENILNNKANWFFVKADSDQDRAN